MLNKRLGFPILISVFLSSLLVGCGSEDKPPPPAIADIGPIPASEQRPGDPERGYDIIVNSAYVSCGMPYQALQQVNAVGLVKYKLSGRQGRNAELPYSFNAYVDEAGVELVVSNCLTCHAAEFNGELVIGLGNEFLDFTEDPLPPIEALGAFIEDPDQAAAWRKWADRIAAIAPFMITDTIGVNPAPNLTMALMAHRDPETLAWSQQPLLELPQEQPLPVSVPPWWRMQKKHAMFYHGGGRADHARIMMAKALVCSDSIAAVEAIDAYFPDVRAFISNLKPPTYPYAIDMALAEQGRDVFTKTCSACHGDYGDEWHYPNLLVGLEQVGTDPAYARQAVQESERFINWLHQSWYGKRAQAMPGLGYVAPPLDGVWATAPYLHNGSVPTIVALLESDTRPRYWAHTQTKRDYNTQTLGWNYQVFDYGKTEAQSTKERKRIYDTTLPGYSNGGHTFGDGLNADERAAVIEYLKTL